MKTDLKVVERYKPLIGPFGRGELEMAMRIVDSLRASGARVIVLYEDRGGSAGDTIYRLRSECESCEQTAARMAR